MLHDRAASLKVRSPVWRDKERENKRWHQTSSHALRPRLPVFFTSAVRVRRFSIGFMPRRRAGECCSASRTPTGRAPAKRAKSAIIDGLTWLEIDWDGEPVYQHANQARHREIAEQLLASGKAYHCYCSAEELTQMREQARTEGRAPIYDGRWRDRDPSDAPAGVPPVIRFRAPQEGETIIQDHVQGRVSFANKDLDDLILLRSDGSPTYMLSVVVDDHDMGISHVVRGDDHLTNAARQIQIFDALDWAAPSYAHVPLIHGADGAKLSKRHGALGVEAYRDMGYLPEAIRNYLVRLGWSHGDDEIFSIEDMIRWFDLDGIGRAAARFDFAKLESLNSHYIAAADGAILVKRLHDLSAQTLRNHGLSDSTEPWETLRAALPVLKPRAKSLIDLIEGSQFLRAERPLSLDESAKKIIDDQSLKVLEGLLVQLQSLENWTAAAVEEAIRAYAKQEALKLGAIAQPLRAALTGKTTSPGIFDVVVLLGREEALARIRDLL